MKKVIISILNFNGSGDTIACLKSLQHAHFQGLSVECVIIDNASKEPFSIKGNSFSPLHVNVMQNKTNLGFAGGHNIGIKYALEVNADYVVILNNDTYVAPEFLKEMVAVAEAEERCAVVSPKIYFAPGTEFHKDRYTKNEQGKIIWYAGGEMDWDNVVGRHHGVDQVDDGSFSDVQPTDFCTGCCMLIKTSVLKKAGLFDDRYFLYYEDSDLQERIKRLGYLAYFAPKGIVWHKNAASSGGSGSALQDYYISRNRLLFGFLYAPLRSKFALLREGVGLLLSGREWQKAGVKDFFLSKFGKGSFRP